MSTLTRQYIGAQFADNSEAGGVMPPMIDYAGPGTGNIISVLSDAKARGYRCLLKFTGSPNNIRDASGRFSMTSWQNKVDDAFDRAPAAQWNAFILDGTLLGHNLVDDAKAGSPLFNGVPPTLNEMDSMAAYSKSKWSLLPTCVRIDNIYLKQKSDWTNLDFAWCQWHSRWGAILPWYTNNMNDGRQRGLGTLFAINLLHGGSGDTEPWTYLGAGGGGTGAAMSPQEIDAAAAAYSVNTQAIGMLVWAAGGTFDPDDYYTNFQGVNAALTRLKNVGVGRVMGPINWRGDMPWMNPTSSSTNTGSASTTTVVGGWSIRDAGTAVRGNNITNLVLPEPTTYQAGDLHLIQAHSRDSGRSFLPLSGWSTTKAVSGNSAQGGQLVLYHKIGGATEEDVTLQSTGDSPGTSVMARRAVVSYNTSVSGNLVAVTGSAATWASKTGMGPVPGATSASSDALFVICAARCDDFGGGSVDEDNMSATTGPQSWLRLFSSGNVSGIDQAMFMDIAATAGLASVTTKSWTQTSGSAAGAGAGFMVAFAPQTVVAGQPAAFATDFGDEPTSVSLSSTLSFHMESTGSTPFTYSKVSGPSNVTVDASSGLFNFTPLNSGTYVILLRTENSFGSDTQQLVVLTAAAGGTGGNTAPAITHPGDMSVVAQQLLAFGLSATDADGDTLTYALEPGAPSGAQMDSATGQFIWMPTGEQGPGVYPIVALVSDGQATSRSTFTVTVADVPWTRARGSGSGFGGISGSGNGFTRI